MSGHNSGIEDSLASAFNSSFNMPPAEPAAETSAEKKEDAPSDEPVPAGDSAPEGEAVEDWRPSYEANLASWRAEADEARTVAEARRAKYEAELEATEAAVKDEKKAVESAKKEEEERVKREARLAAALADSPKPATVPAHKRAAAEERERRTREAWELVKPKKQAGDETGSSPSAPPSTSHWEELSAPHSSIEDISAASASRTAASSGSGSSSSPEKDAPKRTQHHQHTKKEDVPLPSGITPTTAQSKAPASAPAPAGVPAAAAPPPADATPSLTLSIFTAPGGLTFKRVMAALGINLILPFVNGIMLGLGEVTARECVRIGRLWWKGERAVAGVWHRDTNGAGSGPRNVSGVGLSGRAAF